jgi:hypothetical protein
LRYAEAETRLSSVRWPAESVRAAFERRCEHDSLDPDDVLAANIAPAGNGETFWQSA